jgi:hypothetical protein
MGNSIIKYPCEKKHQISSTILGPRQSIPRKSLSHLWLITIRKQWRRNQARHVGAFGLPAAANFLPLLITSAIPGREAKNLPNCHRFFAYSSSCFFCCHRSFAATAAAAKLLQDAASARRCHPLLSL